MMSPSRRWVFDDQEKVYSTSFRIHCYNQVAVNSLRVSQGLNNIVPAGALAGCD